MFRLSFILKEQNGGRDNSAIVA